jgi:hypothetical protein
MVFMLIAILLLLSVGYFIFVQGFFSWIPDMGFTSATQASGSELSADLLTQVPRQEDWVDYGPILEGGGEGEWDFMFAGDTPASMVKKDGIYYFYYIGADGYRSFDGGPRHRSIGVATSEDGINYQKYAANPIMRHSPLNGEEEGANSAGLTLDDNGVFVMYYGGAIGPRDLINADGRLALSTDGFKFEDQGIVLNRKNPFLYGFGDEIFPVAAFQHEGKWNVYYQPNGALNERTLGLAWGSRMDWLPRSIGVLDERSGGKPVGTWGNVVWLSKDRIALFIQRLWWPDTFVEVRTASADAPHWLSEPLVRYDFPNLKRGTAFFDADTNTWFMIYNQFDRFWRLKLAPGRDRDETPPTKPVILSGEGLEHDTVRLTWHPATDPDSGVVEYRIYRDGVRVGSTKGLSFIDTGLAELSNYHYEISAVNFHGVEGQRAIRSVETPADLIPPRLISTTTDGNSEQLILTFSELVDQTGAEDPANYTIQPDIEVIAAVLLSDHKTVKLSTSPHQEEVPYLVKVENVSDRGATPNVVGDDNAIVYTHSPTPGMIGYWNLDERAGNIAYDLSGYGNHGVVEGADWQQGRIDGALQFDGVDDYVILKNPSLLSELDGSSFTFSTWVKPEGIPKMNRSFAILLRVGTHPDYHHGLKFNATGQFVAQVITSDENFLGLPSHPVEIGVWHHVTMVLDREEKQFHLFVNGVEVAGSPMTYEGELMEFNREIGEKFSSGEIYLGSSRPDRGGGSYFRQHLKGYIDEVRIFNQALDREMIRCLAGQCP